MPCYLDRPGCPPGARFNYAGGKDALPAQRPGNTQTANFECAIPVAARQAPGARRALRPRPARRPGQIDETNIRDMSAEHDFAFCATAWSGMSAEDVPNAVKLLGDLSGFHSLADRIQQGFLNQLYLGRLLIHPQGLTRAPRLRRASSTRRALYYDGNSQGGILGTALTAIAPDFPRAVLGVPGINFSVLLTRSSNWDTYGAVFNPAYPRESERPLALALINMLWDRGEGDGCAHHVTTTRRAGTPAHRVLLHVSVGDWQVTPYQADVLARTIGASAHKPRTRQVARSSACRCTASRHHARPVRGLGDRVLGQRRAAQRHRRRGQHRRRARARTRTTRRARPPRRGARRQSSCSPAT